MVIFGKCHHKTFRRYLEPTATGNFDMGAFELGKQRAKTREYGYVEAISMRIPDKNVTCVRYINTIRKVGDGLAPNSPSVFAIFIEYYHAMTLL